MSTTKIYFDDTVYTVSDAVITEYTSQLVDQAEAAASGTDSVTISGVTYSVDLHAATQSLAQKASELDSGETLIQLQNNKYSIAEESLAEATALMNEKLQSVSIT